MTKEELTYGLRFLFAVRVVLTIAGASLLAWFDLRLACGVILLYLAGEIGDAARLVRDKWKKENK